MGSFSSKLIKNNCADGIEKTVESKDRIQIPDPRSPTGEIVRTPITIENEKMTNRNGSGRNLENGRSSVMRQRLLKKLKLDPRSPSEGISRTPIYLETTPKYKSNQNYNTEESPLSIYSHNFSNIDSMSEIMTPTEPSVNVSGFERYKNRDLSYFEDSKDDLDEHEVKYDENQVNSANQPEEKINITKNQLRVSTKPSTAEARRILNEILSSKELEEELPFEEKKQRKQVKQKSLTVHCDKQVKVSEKKKEKLKYRTPLSNITHTTNSPNTLSAMKKPYARCKILSDAGLENTISPKIRQTAEWDKDKTVII